MINRTEKLGREEETWGTNSLLLSEKTDFTGRMGVEDLKQVGKWEGK